MVEAILSRLSRVTSGGKLVREIDGLRFFAVLGVVVCHLNSNIGTARGDLYGANPINEFWFWLFSHGSVGVPLFFAISGFVLALPFAEHRLAQGPRPKLGKYFLRRVTRLEPPYIANLLLLTMLLVLIKGKSFDDLLPHLLASAFYVHNLIYDAHSLINVVAWSLEIEVQFYILAPLIATVFLVRGTLARRCLVVALACLFAAVQNYTPESSALFRWCHMSIVYAMQYFLMGFLLVDLYLIDWNKAPRRGLAWDGVCSLSWLGLVAAMYVEKYSPFTMPAMILLIYVGCFRGVVWNRIVCNRWLVTFGGMCYTLYLYHGKILYAMGGSLNRIPATGRLEVDLLVHLLISYPVVLALGSAIFVCLEKPFMQRDWPARFWQKARESLGR